NRPNSSARVIAPMAGWANSTTPNATETRPPRMNRARVPAASPERKAAAISTRPARTAQLPTISTRTSAVGVGQASAITPAARSSRPSSRCPTTGPGGAAVKRAHGLQAGSDERVHGEQDDQRQDRDAGPGQRHDPDGEGEDAAPDQGRTE